MCIGQIALQRFAQDDVKTKINLNGRIKVIHIQVLVT